MVLPTGEVGEVCLTPSTSEAGRQSNGLCQIGAGGLVFVDHPERLIHCRAGEGKLAPLIPSLALHAGCGSTGDAASAAASVDPAGGDQLGIHGRNASASDGLQSAESDRIPGVALVRRYALQGAARELLPNERSLQGCIRWLHAGTVQLFHIPRHQVGAFGGASALWVGLAVSGLFREGVGAATPGAGARS